MAHDMRHPAPLSRESDRSSGAGRDGMPGGVSRSEAVGQGATGGKRSPLQDVRARSATILPPRKSTDRASPPRRRGAARAVGLAPPRGLRLPAMAHPSRPEPARPVPLSSKVLQGRPAEASSSIQTGGRCLMRWRAWCSHRSHARAVPGVDRPDIAERGADFHESCIRAQARACEIEATLYLDSVSATRASFPAST